MIGFVMSEGRSGKWIIRMANNCIVKLKKVLFDRESGEYIYPNTACIGSEHRVITHYWPVRIMLRISGECKFTLNRLTLDSDNKIVTNLSS